MSTVFDQIPTRELCSCRLDEHGILRTCSTCEEYQYGGKQRILAALKVDGAYDVRVSKKSPDTQRKPVVNNPYCRSKDASRGERLQKPIGRTLREKTRERIFIAIAEWVAKHGKFPGAYTWDTRYRCGIKPPDCGKKTIYEYFRSMDNLYRECIARGIGTEEMRQQAILKGKGIGMPRRHRRNIIF